MDDYLVQNVDMDLFTFTKPKKHGDYLISKIKNNKMDVFIQFPKMLVVSEENVKKIELEFTSDSGYSKKVFNFLSEFDEYLIKTITEKSEEWFGKKIPVIDTMYQKFIKAPKTSENKCTIHFTTKGEMTYKGEPDNVVKGNTLECISQPKFIVFSKDTCFVNWEINTAKIHKKILRVPKFGFIEDNDDNDEIEETEETEETTYSFF
jgi:hypothetical protein